MAFFTGYLTRIGATLAGLIPTITTVLLRNSDDSAVMLAGSTLGAAYVEGPPDVSLTTLIDNVALPAAGAFTTTAYHTLPTGARRVTFLVKYTKHGSATTGQAKKRLMWKFSDTVTDVFEGFADGNSLTVAEPKVAVKGYCLDIAGPKFDGTTTSGTHQWTFEVPAGAVGVAMQLAEISDTTNKGTVSQWVATSVVL